MTYRDDYIGFVYLWENTHPDAKKHKFYIGQHIGNIEDVYIGSGSIFLKKYYCKKYRGFWKRSIIEYCKTEEDLNNAEIKHITEHNACTSKLYCNIREGGKNGKHSEITKLKNSKSNKGRVPWNKGKVGLLKQSQETLSKKRISSAEYYMHEFEKREQFTIEYIKKNFSIKAAVLNQYFSIAKARKTIVSLLNKQKIKLLHFGYNDIRYVDYNFNIEDEIIDLLTSKKILTFANIADHMFNKYQLAKTTTYNILKQMALKTLIISYTAKKQNSRHRALHATIP